MVITTSIVVVFLIAGLAFLLGTMFLQICLSKKENKWLGLILPIICLLFSWSTILSVPAYTNEQLALPIISMFILYTIPTVILMLIYFSCRQKVKKIREIDKMHIQDLE